MNELFIVLVVAVVGAIAYKLGESNGRKKGYEEGACEKRKSWNKDPLPKDKNNNVK